MIESCACENYVLGGKNSDILSPDEKFARSLIGQHQQIILKSQRIIDEIKNQYGLKS